MIIITVLITGITGFVGSHLAEYLLKMDYDVYGNIRWRSNIENIKHILDKIKLIECDLRDAHAVRNLINEVEPDIIFHLAAQSYVPISWKAPADVLETNSIGTVNLLEAVRNSKINPIIQIAGSSEEYGLVYDTEVPITEKNPLRPLSPYGVSKVAADLLGQQYFRSYGLKTIITRAFNHTGPRRNENFVCSNFAKQLAEISLGLKEPTIYVGNLDAVRDFTDVRDIVNAYYLAVKFCRYGEPYNICSGKGYSIKEVLIKLMAISKVTIKIKKDTKRMRPSDVPILIGDCSKFKSATKWTPKIEFEQTLKDLYEYWVGKLR